MIFQIDGRGREQCLRTNLLTNTPRQQEEFIHQHELSHISTKLTQEQINKMMHVIEEIRLNRYKERL
ncbi:hypothetical protein [Lysinibacillus xylanilyticus]|uniref:hypothetical protein n=1 Tax=Lysinibacillus xylanilyticus TaxID=582475 RepID=UPI003806F461